MFTGLVECTGVLSGRNNDHLQIESNLLFDDLRTGDSIAVNGCCLTLEQFNGKKLVFFTLAETLKRTNLGHLPLHSKVNLERALSAKARMGGHIVQGHIDDAVRLISMSKLSDGDYEMKLALPKNHVGEIVAKGSVAVDGVSLTVVYVNEDFFTVRLIPETRKVTAFETYENGRLINIETDIIGKYICNYMRLFNTNNSAPERDAIMLGKLKEAGFL